MGYFDALAASSFKTDDLGQVLFFPWGFLGRGYVLPTAREADRLKRTLVRVYAVVLLVVIGLVMFAPIWVAFALLVPYTVLYALCVRRVTKDLRPAEDRLTLNESYANQAQRHSTWVLWLLLIGSLLLVAGGLAMLALDPSRWLIGSASAVFFGFCAFAILRMLRAKRIGSAG